LVDLEKGVKKEKWKSRNETRKDQKSVVNQVYLRKERLDRLIERYSTEISTLPLEQGLVWEQT
jgi:hypothetical protein